MKCVVIVRLYFEVEAINLSTDALYAFYHIIEILIYTLAIKQIT